MLVRPRRCTNLQWTQRTTCLSTLARTGAIITISKRRSHGPHTQIMGNAPDKLGDGGIDRKSNYCGEGIIDALVLFDGLRRMRGL